MAAALEDQLDDAPSSWKRAGVLLRAFGRLPAVLALEWLEAVLHGTRPCGVFGQDLRFAARSLRKSPVFAVVSVSLIGLGVGAVTAVFTIFDQVLLRPLPYPAQDRLTYLTNGSHNGATLRGMDGIEAFDLWVAARNEQVNFTRNAAEPLRLTSVDVTPSFFTMFGARPALGRILVEGDLTARSVAVLTHSAWVSVWGSDPGVVGSTIQLNAEPVTVVGVLDASFVVPERLVPRDVQVFRPMNWEDPLLADPGYHAHGIAARLAPAVRLSDAQAQMDRLAASLFEQDLLATRRPVTWPLVPLRDGTVDDARGGLALLLGSVGLLLIVACANVALLFMARGISRVREMSVRRALGAGTRVLVGQLVTESLLVGLLGGLFGVGLAALSLAGFRSWIGDLPRADAIVLDARVLLFTVALSAATALLFGLIPALRSLGEDVSARLRESGRTVTEGRAVRWARSGLIVGEVGVSLVLVTLAGLLLRSFLEVTSRDPGLDAEDVWVVPLNLPSVSTSDEYRQRLDRVLTALESLPAVQTATYGMEMPFEFVGGNNCCWAQRTATIDVVDARPSDGLLTYLHPVSEDFFVTLGTDLVAGTGWRAVEEEVDELPVVLGESLALGHFGSVDAAVGQELQFNRGRVRVVGVAEPTAHYGLDQTSPGAMYLPVGAIPFAPDRATFAIKARAAGPDLVQSIRAAIWSVEPALPVPVVERLQVWIDDSSGVRRLGSALSSVFGAIALLLAAGGLYGTLLYAATQQRRELGIRIALGAGRGRIQGEVLRRGLGLTVVGLAIGLASASYLGRLLESFLWNVSPTDPMSLASASVVLIAAAALASWLPAYRASRTDPLEVLRAD
jgi:predicted permease